MPESNFSETNDRAALRQLARDAESQVESMTRALETLRSTVRRLAAQIEMTDGAAPVGAAGFGFGGSLQAETPAPADGKVFDFSAAAAALSQELASASRSVESTPDAPPVTEFTYERPPAPAPAAEPHAEPEWYGVSDGGSWPVGPSHAKAPPPSRQVSPEAEGAREDETVHTPVHAGLAALDVNPPAGVDGPMPDETEAVAASEEPVAAASEPMNTYDFEQPIAVMDAVAEATDGETPPAQAGPGQDDASGRSLSSGWPDEGMWSQSFDWPAMRAPAVPPHRESEPKDDFRSMVDKVRAELEAARASGETVDVDERDVEEAGSEETRRADVQRMVEEMRGLVSADIEDDLDSGETADEAMAVAEPSADDEEVRREEARLAVEAMRSEMAAGASGFGDAPTPRPAPSLDWSHMSAEVSGPPVIVVKDSEGRVELANVYDLLARLDCGESAALLNYTPHSVTVGLPIRSPIPTQTAIEAAVSAIFGRTGSVDTDGVRITVRMGTDSKSKRSEDAA